ncbi:MAG: iron ABC transporter permease [Clostridia bacterium]|nr:iron ABC transporter permease [Clostridia bacterium]
MRNTTVSNQSSHTMRNRTYLFIGVIFLIILFFAGLFIGKYPLSISGVLGGDQYQVRIFWTLRFSRTVVGLVGGFALGISGFVFQLLFRNPLASPDIIGVSSGASAGAAFGILFFSGVLSVSACAFSGALIAVVLAILLSGLDRSDSKATVILAGIAVHSLAQTVLMVLKSMADPEKQLASIEYWIMGSLSGVKSETIMVNIIICIFCVLLLFLLHRQCLLLSQEEAEARMLGVSVQKMRFLVLVTATMAVSSVVSMTGLISFIGLIAPHSARRLTKDNSVKTMFLAGIIGGCLLLLADILARSVAQTELPVSIFTSLIGAPFLIYLIFRRRHQI